MPMYLCRFRQTPDFSATLSLLFLQSKTCCLLKTSQRRRLQPAWLLQAVPHPFPSTHCAAEGLLTLSRLFCRSAKQPEPPSRSMILTWDGCSVQAKTGLLLMAMYKLAAQGFPCGFHFGWILCHNVGCFLEQAFETICLAATCDRCCPNRVQDMQGSSEANTTPPKTW